MSEAVVSCADLDDTVWRQWPVCSYADPMAVFRFRMNDSTPPDYRKTVLQPEEINRAQRFFREEDRSRFVCARQLLRILVGHYTHANPAEIRFRAGKNKKPEIEGTGRWHINVSHSGKWILVAIGTYEVGVDVEKNDPDFMFQDVLGYSFSPAEQQFIQSGNARSLFYRLWTRKEALVKATGKGLDDDFRMVPCLDGKHRINSERIGATGQWTVRSFTLPEGYLAALTYGDQGITPEFYAVDSGLFDQ